MTLGTLLKYINYISNKEQSGNTLSVDEFNTLLPIFSLKYFKKKYSLPEEFRVGMPFSRQSYEITQSIIDSVHQFKKVLGVDAGALKVNSQGKAILPSDYMHVSSAYLQKTTSNDDCSVDVDYSTIEFLTDSEYSSRLGSALKPPSDYPIATIRSNYIQFMPKDVGYINFTYLRSPNTPYYDSYINETTEERVYLAPGEENPITGQPSKSVELEYDDIDIIDIASMMLEKIGINLRDRELKVYSEQMRKEGE